MPAPNSSVRSCESVESVMIVCGTKNVPSSRLLPLMKGISGNRPDASWIEGNSETKYRSSVGGNACWIPLITPVLAALSLCAERERRQSSVGKRESFSLGESSELQPVALASEEKTD